MRQPVNTEDPEIKVPDNSKRRRSPLSKILRGVLIAVAAVVVLIIAAISSVVFILSPDRLTPLVERYAPEFINGKLQASRIELFYWSTFPKITLEIDSLTLLSDALSSAPAALRDSLPAGSDTLVEAVSLHGSINLPNLLKGKVTLSGVEINGLRANVVKADSIYANYNIATALDSTENSDGKMPDIEFDHFLLTGLTTLRYVSLPDSIDATLRLTQCRLDGIGAPLYDIDIQSDAQGRLSSLPPLTRLPLGVDGRIRWNLHDPTKLALEPLTISVDSLPLTVNAAVEMGDTLLIDRLTVQGKQLPIQRIYNLVARFINDPLPEFSSDRNVDFEARLRSSFKVGVDRWPDLEMSVDIPEGHLQFDRLNLNRFSATIKASLPPSGPDNMRIELTNLLAVGRAVGFKASAVVDADGSLADPLIHGDFKGGVGFAALPVQLTKRLPVKLRGRFTGETTYRFRPSYLTQENFHKLRMNGNMKLSDFYITMADSAFTAYTKRAVLKFGTNSRITTDMHTVDSLLTVSLTVDTVSYMGNGGISFFGNDLSAGIGARNVAGSLDSTAVIPIGTRISGRRLTMVSDSDSTRIRLRDLNIKGSITRFMGNKHKPLLNLDISSHRLRYSDRYNRVNLTDAGVLLTLHPRKRPRMSVKQLQVFDSLSYVYPNLSVDSIYALTLATRRAQRVGKRNSSVSGPDTVKVAAGNAWVNKHTNDLDFGVDNSIKSWLRLWEASGTIRARRGRAFTPYFPVRNMLDSLDITFSTDSVNVRHAHYRSGQTSMTLRGSISNITSAVTSRRGAPIMLDFDLSCDTLDINSFAQAAFAGSAFAQRIDSINAPQIVNSDKEEDMQRSIEEVADSTPQLAFVVPSNVKAQLRLSAREVLYADIWFQRLQGLVEVANGAVHLNRLAGFTEMGTIDLTVLYSAPDLKNVSFAGGIVVRRLDLKKFLHFLPEIDSIMPLLHHIEGMVTADMAMTSELDSLMDIKFHTLKAAIRLDGDSLVLLDNDTFRKISRLLLFKKKDRNMIEHMSAELLIDNSYLELMPFTFDFDRYKLGVWGGNDLDMHYDYHIAVLKSPIPFKFGVTVKGHGKDFRIGLGRANFDPDKIVSQRKLTDTARINLIDEIKKVFHFGVSTGEANKKLELSAQGSTNLSSSEFSQSDALSHADSVFFMQEGVIPMTPAVADSIANQNLKAVKHQKKPKKSRDKPSSAKSTRRNEND